MEGIKPEFSLQVQAARLKPSSSGPQQRSGGGLWMLQMVKEKTGSQGKPLGHSERLEREGHGENPHVGPQGVKNKLMTPNFKTLLFGEES